MTAEAVFGAFWFWMFAALIWLRAATATYGVPRRLLRVARNEVGAAEFARDLARFRLGAGAPLPIGLGPLRWPFLGAATAYGVIGALSGEALGLALVAAFAPIAAASLALETRAIAAVRPEATLEEFRAAFEDCQGARLAATLVSIAATVIAGAWMLSRA